VEGTVAGSMDLLAEWSDEAERVLVF